MGLFDGLVEGLINLPGQVVKSTIETVVRTPEVVIRTIDGAEDGLASGVDKLKELFDDE